ncbi:zinc finger protein 182-like [Plodia interpunctella]|uniref:zinc finger protein 182-like n=1 Tax=Plodia interpunctella TaxID=58824 RepID=UPI0023681F3F|nr:zinc finger protein 182-like [Plodia interpunctella]
MSNCYDVCRICLATGVRMFTFVGTPLQTVYEKFINCSVQSEKRPLIACYICHAQLKRSHNLMLKCIKSKMLLNDLLRTCSEITSYNVAEINRVYMEPRASLGVCPIQHTDYNTGVEVDVKIEPLWHDSEVVNPEVSYAQFAFDFVSVPAEPCPPEVMVKVEPQDDKTEPVSPPPMAVADQSEIDAGDLPLRYVDTVMADGITHKGFSAETKNQPVETNTELDKTIKDKTRMHECHFCDRKFKAKGALNEHLRIHSGEKPYECNICNIKFTKKRNLDIHLRIHTGEKPHQCEVCKRKFSEAVNLKRHVRTHTGEKPYECDVCHRKFNEAVNLKRHKRTHTGEKPYQCPFPPCDNKFSQKITLERHIRTHTGEKPYECTLCNAKFLANSGLSRHIKTHCEEHSFASAKKYYVLNSSEKPFE